MKHLTVFIRSIILQFVVVCIPFFSFSQQASSDSELNRSFIDSLELTYSSLKGEERINKIISHCRDFGYFHPDEIIYLIDKTLREVRENGNQQAEIDLLFQKNYILSDAYSDLEGSRKLSLQMIRELPVSNEQKAHLLDFIARTHLAKSELVKAQKVYRRALMILEEMDDDHTSAHINVYWGVAVTYAESKNYEKSSEYYQKCLDESRLQGKTFMISSCLQNLAANALEMNDLKSAKTHLNEAKRVISEISNKSDREISNMGLYNAYGDFYHQKGDLDSAIVSFQKALKLSDIYDDFFTKSYAMHSIGAVYLELNRLKDAETLLLQSHDMFKEKTPSLLLKNSLYLYQLYKKTGDYDEALKWHETYAELNDSVQKAENIEVIANATSKYEAALKDKTIDLLEKEKLIEEQSKERYKNRWQIVIVLLLLVLVLGAFYLNHNRHQKKKKKIIHQVLGEERERERISMELHDGICSEISTISRSVRNQQLRDETEWRKHLANRLDHLNLEVRDISHNLALLKFDQNTSFEEILEDYIGDLKETVPIDFSLHFSLENEHIYLEANRELVLFRVIQEICNNAIKYSQAEIMNVSFTQKGNNVDLIIRDSGTGFDPSEKGNGIRNIFERIEFLGGNVHLDTGENGTSYHIQVPLTSNEFKHT